MQALSKLVTHFSTIISRARTASLVGKTFNGSRDLYAALGYSRTLTLADYRERVRRNGIAKRVVYAFPQATWRNSPIITEKGVKAEDSDFAKKFADLALQTKLFHNLERVDKLSGIGSYGTLLMGIRASGALKDKVRVNVNREIADVLFLAPYLQESSPIQDFEIEPTSARFGLPKLYNVSLMGNESSAVNNAPGKPTVPSLVHESRMIHIAEDLQEDNVFGAPRLEAIWNYLDDLDKIMGSAGEAFWRVVDRGIQFDVDKDAQLSEEDEDDLTDEIEEYMHGFKRYLRTRGIKANVLGSEAPDPTGAIKAAISLISGSSGIPNRILTGSEMGQLASGQDDKNFNARVRERQNSFAEPKILRPFIDRMIEFKVLPMPKDGYVVKWPDLSTLTDKEKADVSARRSQAYKNITDKRPEVMTVEEKRSVFFDLAGDIPEEIKNLPIPGVDDTDDASDDDNTDDENPPEGSSGHKDDDEDETPKEKEARMSSAPQPISVTVHTPPVEVTIEKDATVVNVESPEITLPATVVNVGETHVGAPVIHIEHPEAPHVTIENIIPVPEVTVQAPDVEVNVDVAAPSVAVTNEVEPAAVHVTNEIDLPAPEVEITIEGSKDAHVDFNRDSRNRITSADIEDKS